jgi:hypothetical protein
MTGPMRNLGGTARRLMPPLMRARLQTKLEVRNALRWGARRSDRVDVDRR